MMSLSPVTTLPGQFRRICLEQVSTQGVLAMNKIKKYLASAFAAIISRI
jgi:hypothetical protein